MKSLLPGSLILSSQTGLHSSLPRAHILTFVTQASLFYCVFFGRITKVFSLVLLSCDQSIAREMGSLESCLSKISYFTGWSILREHSAPSLPRANISVTWVVGARLRPHILCLVKENTAPVRTFPFGRPCPAPSPACSRRRTASPPLSRGRLNSTRGGRFKDKKL